MRERAGEDLLTTLLDSLEELVKNVSRINRWLLYAIYLLLLWIFVSLLLWSFSILHFNVEDIILYAFLISIALLILFALVDIRENLAMVIGRYSAYKYMEKMSLQIPQGEDPVDRLIKHFNISLNFEKELRKRKGKIIRGSIDCGEKLYFDYYAEIRKRPLDSLRGRKSYSLFIIKMDELSVAKLEELAQKIKRCSQHRNVEISRVIVITTKELSDEVYDYLVAQKAGIPLQVAIEMEDGTYDFIPFIAPRHDMLP